MAFEYATLDHTMTDAQKRTTLTRALCLSISEPSAQYPVLELPMTQQFRPHSIYFLLTVAMLLLAGLLGWNMRTNMAASDLLFLLITLVAAFYFLAALTTSVRVTDRAIHIHRPLYLWHSRSSRLTLDAPLPGEEIDFRQLISIDRGGRLFPSLNLLYYPLRPDGLIDTERVIHLTLPVVTNQNELQERLEAVIPV